MNPHQIEPGDNVTDRYQNGVPRILTPPIWIALVFSMAGILGMDLVYESVTGGGVWRGLTGGFLLVVSVVIVGTPLAYARLVRKSLHAKPGNSPWNKE